MLKLTKLESSLYNEGERLIPGLTHNLDETIRHKSSYIFFKSIIENDIKLGIHKDRKEIRILDIGFGAGYGCKILSSIEGSEVVGIDISEDCREYAIQNYNNSNIKYEIVDTKSYIDSMPEFDYIVSRGVLEHIEDGLKLVVNAKYRCRMIINVPYQEKELNPHHFLLNISEKDFDIFQDNKEFFFEDMKGYIFAENSHPNINMITSCMTKLGLPKIKHYFNFPIKPWSPSVKIRIALIPKKIASYLYSYSKRLVRKNMALIWQK